MLDGSTTLASATVALAQPPALVAAKLQSMRTRRGEHASKAVSDVYDTYRLLTVHDGEGFLADALASAPMDVGAWCAEALIQTFVAEAAQWARRINDAFAAPAVEPGDLEVVGSLAAERIGRGPHDATTERDGDGPRPEPQIEGSGFVRGILAGWNRTRARGPISTPLLTSTLQWSGPASIR